MWRHFFQGLCDLIYPRHCIACKAPLWGQDRNQFLCSLCQQAIEWNKPPFCTLCSRPFNQNHSGKICPTCRQSSYWFDQVWAATLYNGLTKRLIHLFKYHNKTSLRLTFADWIMRFSSKNQIDFKRFDLLVPVPLHPTRQRERGYNQTQLIAERLAAQLNKNVSLKNLLRNRHTPSQALLNQKQRWTNISGAFTIKYPQEFENKNILICDDLFTTGATTSEIARILKESGARNVEVLALSITQ